MCRKVGSSYFEKRLGQKIHFESPCRVVFRERVQFRPRPGHHTSSGDTFINFNSKPNDAGTTPVHEGHYPRQKNESLSSLNYWFPPSHVQVKLLSRHTIISQQKPRDSLFNPWRCVLFILIKYGRHPSTVRTPGMRMSNVVFIVALLTRILPFPKYHMYVIVQDPCTLIFSWDDVVWYMSADVSTLRFLLIFLTQACVLAWQELISLSLISYFLQWGFD